MSAHDKVNLVNLVSRLEQSVGQEDWSDDAQRYKQWIRARGMLQKIKHARKLLKNVEVYEESHSTSLRQDYLDTLRTTLSRLQDAVETNEKRLAPKPIRPEPLLPNVPLPAPDVLQINSPTTEVPEAALLPAEVDQPATLPTSDLLLSPDDAVPPPSILSTPAPPPASSSPFSSSSPAARPGAAKPSDPAPSALLQNSAAVQDELSAQLAQMAAQLRRNAEHFKRALDTDREVIEAADVKLEDNHGEMTTTRVRLRDRGVSARGTTCYYVAAVVGVALAFVVMVMVIRVT